MAAVPDAKSSDKTDCQDNFQILFKPLTGLMVQPSPTHQNLVYIILLISYVYMERKYILLDYSFSLIFYNFFSWIATL
jgi:hypothetical protein